MRKGILSRWTRPLAVLYGIFKWVEQCTLPRWRSKWTEKNTSRSQRVVRCTRLVYRRLSRRLTISTIQKLSSQQDIKKFPAPNRPRSKSGQNVWRNYHVFITSAPFVGVLLTLRQSLRHAYLTENKLAEACASRTHRRHQRCRPPVLKTGRITGPHALPRPDTTASGRCDRANRVLARKEITWVGPQRAGMASAS
jgi:hypothetical protein